MAGADLEYPEGSPTSNISGSGKGGTGPRSAPVYGTPANLSSIIGISISSCHSCVAPWGVRGPRSYGSASRLARETDVQPAREPSPIRGNIGARIGGSSRRCAGSRRSAAVSGCGLRRVIRGFHPRSPVAGAPPPAGFAILPPSDFAPPPKKSPSVPDRRDRGGAAGGALGRSRPPLAAAGLRCDSGAPHRVQTPPPATCAPQFRHCIAITPWHPPPIT